MAVYRLTRKKSGAGSSSDTMEELLRQRAVLDQKLEALRQEQLAPAQPERQREVVSEQPVERRRPSDPPVAPEQPGSQLSDDYGPDSRNDNPDFYESEED